MKRITEITQWLIEILLIMTYPLVSLSRLFLPLHKITSRPTKKAPIIIVEQWFSKNAYHIFMKKYLEKKGFVVYWFNFSLLRGGIDEGAQALKKFIDNRNLQNVVLVGISVGAVTSLIYLEQHNGWRKVKKLISIGGPFKGTPLAYFIFFLKTGRQLLPNSIFLQRLFARKLTHPDRIISLTSLKDEMVPPASSKLSTMNTFVLNRVGHNNLHVWSKETFKLILDEAQINP